MYDPLLSPHPGIAEPFPDSYWASTAGTPPQDDGQLTEQITVDVAIIGGGYTGLSTAYHLAREQGIEAVVLEANQAGWGCSGRNGGFALKAAGRMPYQKMIRRFGLTAATSMFNEMYQGLERLRGFIKDNAIECDQQPDGHLWVAHRKRMLKHLEGEAAFLQKNFDYQVDLLSAQALREQHFVSDEALGALRFRHGFGVHPLKLAFAYQRLVREAGVKVYSGTPVLSWRKEGNYHILRSAKGWVKARRVVCATNGYTAQQLHPGLSNRTYPVLSNVIVTRPLTENELAQTAFKTSDIITDTRTLRFYYRKLADNRILIGGRSAVTGADAANEIHNRNLQQALGRKFAPLQGIDYQYAWGGWVSVTFDDLPHVHHVKGDESVFYAMGYGGSGVSFSLQAGARLAEKIAGAEQSLPFYSLGLPRFPLASCRRLGQRAFYHYYYAKDEY